MRLLVPLALIVVALSGCGPDCQNSCEKIFGDGQTPSGDQECAIQVPGVASDEMIRDCVGHCQAALRQNGEIGAYNPDEAVSGNDKVTLDNEKQAALWMECIDATACEYLQEGVCAPVKNFPAN